VQCTIAPCASNTKAKECAARVSDNAACRDNYCGGCNAEWYVGTTRICTDVPDTCSGCPNACPANSKRKINPFTGCEDCSSGCVTTCPAVQCDAAVQCPYGRKVDSDGCPTCTCNPCPDLANCNLQCPNNEYLVDPNTQCRKCACASSGCSTNTPCDLTCPNGFTVDANGCKECKCKTTCPTLNCPAVACLHGRVFKDGCETCDCLPYCQNQCPFGYDFNSGAVSNSLECKCYCKPLVCDRACANNAYIIDRYGCKTCECVVQDTCPKVMCDLYCEHGYVKDEATGCPKCECVQKPTICPAVLCAENCIYGRTDDSTGCPSCQCKPCPEVLCARYCPFGYKKGTNGCEYCDCNPAPTCATGSVNVADVCPLNCQKGYVTDSGCTYCKCNPVEPCKCDSTNTDPAVLCADGLTYQKTTDICARTDDNKCYFVQTKCPIGIEIIINVKLTEDQIKAIAAKVGATNAADFSTKVVETSAGKFTYTIWVKKEGIPEGKTANDVNSDVSTEAKKSDPDAVSYVLSDGSVTQSFANVLVPFIGLIALVLFF